MKISAEGQKNSIRITNDQSQYWSDKSKGYAEDAKKSATEAKGYADTASASVIEANNIVKDFDAHVVTKTNEFDEHTVAKQEEFDTHASVKQNDFDVNAANVTARFDNNYLDKTKDFNTNATNKTSAFDSNATLKTNAFNNNATAKTAIIDSKIEQAELAETNANIWAEGSDAQVRTLGGEHSAKGWNGVVSQTANAGVSSINNSTKDGVDLLNRTATNIAKEKYNNSAKGYLTGEVSTDEIMVNQLVDMKHSTFDKSKFTVVGSPTITDDGIASGFSNANYLETTSIDRRKPFKQIVEYTPITNKNDGGIYSEKINTTYFSRLYNTNGNKLAVLLTSDGKGWDIGKISSDISLELGTSYIIEFGYTGIKYYLKIYKNNILLETKEISSATKMRDLPIIIGKQGIVPANGSIDLKQFSISVDGKEVFNGNKTGIDIIKPDNFTKQGNPVISNDGVASGFSTGNYIINKNILNSSRTFLIAFPTFILKSLKNEQIIFTTTNENGRELYGIDLEVFNSRLRLRMNTSSGWNIVKFNNKNLSLGTKYLSYLKFDGVKYEFIIKTNNDTESIIIEDSNHIADYSYYTLGASTEKYLDGSIDLNAFKIYVDGNLVYQPLLRIPYTKSSTGSKVVDSIYRDRVQDVYKQYGNALYYTLDETKKDCTLPIGELYGFIGAATIVREKQYADGWLIEYSNGFCMQGGNFSTTSSTEYTLNFYSKFRDTKYIILRNTDNGNQENVWYRSVYFYSKTASSAKTYCVANNQNDWVAYGFIR